MLESEERVDYNQIAYYPSICANRWAPDGSVQSVTVCAVYCMCPLGLQDCSIYTVCAVYPFPRCRPLNLPKETKRKPILYINA